MKNQMYIVLILVYWTVLFCFISFILPLLLSSLGVYFGGAIYFALILGAAWWYNREWASIKGDKSL